MTPTLASLIQGLKKNTPVPGTSNCIRKIGIPGKHLPTNQIAVQYGRGNIRPRCATVEELGSLYGLDSIVVMVMMDS